MKHKTPSAGTFTGKTPHQSLSDIRKRLCPRKPKFRLGRVVITPAALNALRPEDIDAALRRHVSVDWSDAFQYDRKEKEFILRSGMSLLSLCRTEEGKRFKVITQDHPFVTTVLLPEDG